MKKRIMGIILSSCMFMTAVFSVSANGNDTQLCDCCDCGNIVTFEEFVAEKSSQGEIELFASIDADYLSWNYSSVLEEIREAILDGDDYVSFGEKIDIEDMYMISYIIGNCFDGRLYLDYSTSKSYVKNADIVYNDDFTKSGAKAFYAGIDDILMYIEPDMTDFEKMLVVHDYMALNYEYDHDYYIEGGIKWDAYSAYGIITNKTGVCQAYAEAYMSVLAMLDIPCQLISSDGMNHAWNLVRLDGDWYHVDVTWDDPTYNGDDKIGYAGHEHFLFSDIGAGDVRHFGWESDTVCDNEQYDDAFWKDSESKIIFENDKVYYLTYDGVMCRNGFDADAEETVLYDKSIWEAHGLDYCNGELYYLGDGSYFYDLYAMDLDTLDSRVVEVDLPEGYRITGFYINGKNLTYCIQNTQDDKRTTMSMQLIDKFYVNSISLEIPENIYVGKTYDIVSSVSPKYADSKELEWSVSDESVMTVTQDGEIKALKEGIVTLTATATDGSGIYKSSEIIVSQPASVPVADVIVSKESGMVAKGTTISLATDTVGATIYYTTDGSEPTAESTVYNEPIEITESVTIKAIALKEGREDSKICEFEYKVAVPESMTVRLTDYGYMVWNSGEKNLSAMKFNINNSEGEQNVSAIMAIYGNGVFVHAFSKDITADGNENEVVFSDLGMELNESKTYKAKVFLFGKDYPMFPFGRVTTFNIKIP